MCGCHAERKQNLSARHPLTPGWTLLRSGCFLSFAGLGILNLAKVLWSALAVLSHEFQNLSYELLSQHVLNFVLMCQIQAVFQALRPSSLVTYHKGLSHHNSFFASHPVLYNSFFASHVVLYNSLSGVVAHSDVGIMRLFQNASGFSRMVNNDRTQDPRLRRRPKPESRSSLD